MPAPMSCLSEDEDEMQDDGGEVNVCSRLQVVVC